MESPKLLSILICSVQERETFLAKLLQEFETQRGLDVEILTDIDNKEVSIGAKRQRILERATGKWVVYFDDDDWPYSYYVQSIIETIENNPDADCIGINVYMTTNGTQSQRCLHRLGLKWETIPGARTGYHYHRNITHFNPVLREKALQAGFKNMRFGEDVDYCNRLNALLHNEAYIARPLFHYRYSNKQVHNEKYGII